MSWTNINKFKSLPAFCRRLRVGLVALDCVIGLIICQTVLLGFLYGCRAVSAQMRRCRAEKFRTLEAYRFLFGPRRGKGMNTTISGASVTLSQGGTPLEHDVISLEVLDAGKPRYTLIRC